MRSVVACVVPIFAPDLFGNLGWGIGSTILACVGAVAIPAPAIVRLLHMSVRSRLTDPQMFIWGKQLREKYKFDG